ncbi:MAG TPA: HEAT repeat domain-containing protein [Candidatus Angelobacter sp.]|jgi:hypothetical protein|nr:HEAT repeat domain-containing protein [Candidatus Angelobacter sp.]
MTCESMAELLADHLQGRLQPEQAARVKEHLQQCMACQADAAMWQKLATFPAQQPSPAMKSRFNAMLDSYQEGRWEKANLKQEHGKFLDFGAIVQWARTPALSVAASFVLVLCGFLAGRYIDRPQPANIDVSEMRNELASMRQLVVIAMLKQQSPSERLQGVGMVQQNSDPRVLEALLHTLRYDNSVDVRLAALDALSHFSSHQDVRKGLIDSLGTQQSPLVQIALIDVLVDMRDHSAVDQLKRLQQDPALDPSVKKRADWGIQQLS